MTVCWEYHQQRNQWTYRQAGQQLWVPCDRYGWIKLDALMPENGRQVEVVGILRHADASAQYGVYHDRMWTQEHVIGGQWIRCRDVVRWKPISTLPVRYQVGSLAFSDEEVADD